MDVNDVEKEKRLNNTLVAFNVGFFAVNCFSVSFQRHAQLGEVVALNST